MHFCALTGDPLSSHHGYHARFACQDKALCQFGCLQCEVSRATFDHRIATSDPLLARVAERYGATLVRPADFLCNGSSCAVLRKGKPL
ncbi:SGNH hydrolase domain-containing protein [Alteraurantiacibacter lauratis]|uniref:SGNH hydrolase domain-containing protein n=1 Tax=Alteraurantiacibacter lauratis TaxID=2054627 RepID=A0ABV7EBG5_9SPHN